MKKIAFLSYDWDYEIMSEYYKGMNSYACAHEDIQVFIFNAYGQYANYQPEEGAFEIFTLCNLEKYDGFIIQGNRTWPPDMRQEIVNRIVALHKPIVSINYELDGTHVVGTDNYQAMYGLVEKVLSDRACLRPAFVNGLATSAEAQARTQAFYDACAAAGVTDVRFYQANWQMDEGVKAALKMLDNPNDLPDVVFCCNDDLAVGVQETLQDHGVEVPEEVMVAGFDNREISLKAIPRITTIDRDYFTIGYTAIESIDRLVGGEDLPTSIVSKVKYVLSESCGYFSQSDSLRDMADDLYYIDYGLKHFYQVLSQFQPAVLTADSLIEILALSEEYLHEIRCPNVYVTVNGNYLRYDVEEAATSYGSVSHLMACHGPDSPPTFDDRHIYATYLTKEILPPEVALDKPVYLVFPLRHRATCIGTFVVEGVSPLMQFGFLTFFLTLLAGSVESVRKKEMLQLVNSKLDDLYVHDQLTGLFNRFGLDRFGKIAYEHLLRDFEEAQFIFVDIDSMKLINDVCGHEMGDQALLDVASIINRAITNENAFAMRYGGDEFLLISRRNLIPKLKRELEALKRTTRRPFDLTLSMGSYRVCIQDHCTVKQAIDKADAEMYEIKKHHKAQR